MIVNIEIILQRGSKYQKSRLGEFLEPSFKKISVHLRCKVTNNNRNKCVLTGNIDSTNHSL